MAGACPRLLRFSERHCIRVWKEIADRTLDILLWPHTLNTQIRISPYTYCAHILDRKKRSNERGERQRGKEKGCLG